MIRFLVLVGVTVTAISTTANAEICDFKDKHNQWWTAELLRDGYFYNLNLEVASKKYYIDGATTRILEPDRETYFIFGGPKMELYPDRIAVTFEGQTYPCRKQR